LFEVYLTLSRRQQLDAKTGAFAFLLLALACQFSSHCYIPLASTFGGAWSQGQA
jgi:hypothetical protein